MISSEQEKFTPIGVARDAIDLSRYNEEELLVLRAKVDALLPVKKLADVDLEHELVLQLRAAQALQTRVIDDDHIAANQKAQVMNAVASTIQNLIKMQVEYYTPERLKRIEAALVRTLNTLGDERTKEFFKVYEEELTK